MAHILEVIAGGVALGASRLIASAVYDLGQRLWIRLIRPRLRKPDRR